LKTQQNDSMFQPFVLFLFYWYRCFGVLLVLAWFLNMSFFYPICSVILKLAMINAILYYMYIVQHKH